jgi:hypothetical protein
MTKICTKCGVEKDTGEFPKQLKGKYGVQSKCKLCGRKYWHENKERFFKYRKEYYQKNREFFLERYREVTKKRSKRYYQENKEKIKEYKRQYRARKRLEENR